MLTASESGLFSNSLLGLMDRSKAAYELWLKTDNPEYLDLANSAFEVFMETYLACNCPCHSPRLGHWIFFEGVNIKRFGNGRVLVSYGGHQMVADKVTDSTLSGAVVEEFEEPLEDNLESLKFLYESDLDMPYLRESIDSSTKWVRFYADKAA